jgi:predicted transcriptional regulator of viral defense system
MRFQDFASGFADRPCFTARDASLRFPGFYERQLHRWQQHGWLRMLRRPYYRLTSRPWTIHERWAVANALYSPSYVSLESALGHYGFIPEGVFHITCITTRHTRTFELDGMRHHYRNVLPSWFFGYTILEADGVAVRMASREKALLDVLHFGAHLRGPDDFEAMRFDRAGIREAIDQHVWDHHLSLSTNQALHRRAHAFQRWLR